MSLRFTLACLSKRIEKKAFPLLSSSSTNRGAALYQDQLAVADGNLITAGGIAPIDFAYQIFKKLEVYTPQVLDAWYGLYKTNDPSYFFALVKAAGASV